MNDDAGSTSWILDARSHRRLVAFPPSVLPTRFVVPFGFLGLKASLLSLALALGIQPLQTCADVVNGGFETGMLAPWVLDGAGAAVSNTVFVPSIIPPGGRFMGYITTMINEGAKDFGFFADSPDLDGNGVKETEHSSLSITFTTTVPSKVSVPLNFMTDEFVHGSPPSINDADVFGVATGDVRTGPYLLLLAVAPADGTYTGTAQPLPPDVFSDEFIQESNFGRFPSLPDSSAFRGQTGFSNYRFTVGPGAHTWTFFVADSRTDGVASAMLIDDLTVTPLPDGTETVVQVADINPGVRGSYPSFFTVYRDQLYFRANVGLSDTELWRFDGTNATLVADLVAGLSGSSPANLAVLGDRLYFNATTAAGYRVWGYDGTNAVRVTSANPPYAFFEAAFWKPVEWHGELWYPSQGKVYLFNGERFACLNTPPWAQMDLVLWNGALHYGAQESAAGVELWRFNGSVQTRLSDINPGPAGANPESLYAFSGGIYFRARTVSTGMEPHFYNGTTATAVADINPGAADSNPGEFCAFRDQIYFNADDGVHGYELWRTDGTTTTLAADINPNPIYEQGGDRLSDSHPRRLTVWRDKLYFVANNGSEGGLWCYDGTQTCLVGGGTAGAEANGSGITELIVFRDRLYFDADDGLDGRELWRIEPEPRRNVSIAQQGQQVEVRVNQAETGRYIIEATTDFVSWTPVTTNSAVDGRVTFIDPAFTHLNKRYYRALAAP